MSRIGKQPIIVPNGVTVTIEAGNVVTVKGPKGTLSRALSPDMNIAQEEGKIIVTRPNDLKRFRALHGLTRTLINNMVVGVTVGYVKKLEIVGTGYKAAREKDGDRLKLSLGYSHLIFMHDPEGIVSAVEGSVVKADGREWVEGTKITITGIDKEKVGQYAADIRSKRSPEPYKGKGIKYADEKILRKAGKSGKK